MAPFTINLMTLLGLSLSVGVVVDDAILVLENIYRRMENGLREIEIRVPWDVAEFGDVIRELLARTVFDDGIVYVQVTRGESERKHFYPDDLTPTTIAYSRAFNFPDASKKTRGIALITADELLSILADRARGIPDLASDDTRGG